MSLSATVKADSTGDALHAAAAAALQQYKKNIHGRVIAHTLVESADAAAVALDELHLSHQRTVAQLQDQIASLQSHLFDATALVESLSVKVCNESSPSAARPSSFAIDVRSSHGEDGAELRVSNISSDAFITAHSESATATNANANTITNTENADQMPWRGALQLREAQVHRMTEQLRELSSMLAAVVRENAAQRQELQMLRATSVPLAVHQTLMDERDALEQQSRIAYVEIQRLREEAETALEHAARAESPLRVPSPARAVDPMDSGVNTETRDLSEHIRRGDGIDETNGMDRSGDAYVQHNVLWTAAVKELEQQAILAVTQQSAGAALRKAEERIVELEAERAALTEAFKQLEREDQCVREDCEQLTFRNAVLAQQVASLLVRVEQLRRQKQRRGTDMDLTITAESESDRAGNVFIPQCPMVKKEPQPMLYRQQRRSIEDPSTIVKDTDSDVVFAQRRGRVAAAAQELLTRRGGVGAEYSPGASHLLDATLCPVAEERPLEIERGLRASLDVFAAPRSSQRLVPLRNFGSAALMNEEEEGEGLSYAYEFKKETDEASVERDVKTGRVPPRLPPVDELSGVALGRPPQYATIPLTTQSQRPATNKNNTNYNNYNDPYNKNKMNSDGSSGLGTTLESEEAEENKRFLELLADDEDLSRYSVNSVTELVRRNQELLQQLYTLTQRVAQIEEGVEHNSQSSGSGSSGSSAGNSNSETDAAHCTAFGRESQRLVRKRPRTASSDPNDTAMNSDSQHSNSNSSSSNSSNSNNNTTDEPFDSAKVYSSAPDASLEPCESTQTASNSLYGGAESGPVISPHGEPDELLTAHMDAIMRRHEALAAINDKSLSVALLRIMERYNTNTNNRTRSLPMTNQQHVTPTEEAHCDDAHVLRDAVVASLVRVCAEQGVRCAAQAVELAAAQQSGDAAIALNESWAEAQRVLLRTAADLEAAVRATKEATGHKDTAQIPQRWGEKTVRAEEHESERNEVQLLHRIANLLCTASMKEHTIQHVLRLARRRHRRYGAARKAKGHQGKRSHAHGEREGDFNEEGGEEETAVMVSENVASTDVHIHRESNAPIRANPAKKRRTKKNKDNNSDDNNDDNNKNEDDDDDKEEEEAEKQQEEEEDDRASISSFSSSSLASSLGSSLSSLSSLSSSSPRHGRVRRLRERLLAAHDKYDQLLAAHNTERAQHTVLLDRMWRLEESADAAAVDRDAALERMATMMTREDYEATVGALDEARMQILDMESELRAARDHSAAIASDRDMWRTSCAEGERAQEASALNAARALAERDERVAEHAERARRHEAHAHALLQRIHGLENALSAQARAVEESVREREALCAQLRQAEHALLEQPCTRDTLFAIFPGDRVLVENCNLVQSLRGERTELLERLAEVQVELHDARRELDAARLALRQTEHERQIAELRAAELRARHAHTHGACKSFSSSSSSSNSSDSTSSNSFSNACAHAAEAELLRRELSSLQASQAAWAEREVQLRAQLDALSRDPLSASARRYGLSATRSFEAQLEEMQGRLSAAEEGLRVRDALSVQVSELKAQLEAKHAELKAMAEAQEETRACLDAADTQLRRQAESHDAVKLTLAEKEEIIESITGAIRTLEAEAARVERRLGESEEERAKLYQDNVKLIENVSALAEEVKKKEVERRAAQAALAQGLAASAQRSAALGARGSRASPGPVAVTGTLAQTLR